MPEMNVYIEQREKLKKLLPLNMYYTSEVWNYDIYNAIKSTDIKFYIY